MVRQEAVAKNVRLFIAKPRADVTKRTCRGNGGPARLRRRLPLLEPFAPQLLDELRDVWLRLVRREDWRSKSEQGGTSGQEGATVHGRLRFRKWQPAVIVRW